MKIKYRIKKVEYKNRIMYFVQMKKFLFWHTDRDVYGDDLVFSTKDDAKEEIISLKGEAERENKRITYENIN